MQEESHEEEKPIAYYIAYACARSGHRFTPAEVHALTHHDVDAAAWVAQGISDAASAR